ncbi:MAG: TonB-dependent receptor plug domain-containing protein, partial [Chitinophagaceae bacterium]
MKQGIIIGLLIAAHLTSTAQTLTGKVIDAQTLQPIAGCTLQWDRGQYTLTNDLGVFQVYSASRQSFSIRFTSAGYQSYLRNVQPGTDTLIIALTPWALMMQPVEVRALRAGTLAPFAKTNLTAKDIAALNLGQDLPFLLAQTPSVVITSDAGNGIGYTGIRIRGTDATRINMTINGIPYNDAESQGIFFVNLPDLASSLSSVQIQRGVGSSSNGAGAFGASLNLSTNEVHTEPYAELLNSLGSFQTRKHTLKAGSGLIDQHFTVDVRLSTINSDGYIERAFSDLRSYSISTAY